MDLLLSGHYRRYRDRHRGIRTQKTTDALPHSSNVQTHNMWGNLEYIQAAKQKGDL